MGLGVFSKDKKMETRKEADHGGRLFIWHIV